MGSKFFAGLAFGSLVAAGAWKSLSEDQKEKIASKVKRTVYKSLDVATDYSLEVLDVADNMVQDYKGSFNDKVAGITKKVNDSKQHLSDRFISDNFDEETANLRDALDSARKDNDNDIIIDKTK